MIGPIKIFFGGFLPDTWYFSNSPAEIVLVYVGLQIDLDSRWLSSTSFYLQSLAIVLMVIDRERENEWEEHVVISEY